MKIILAISGGVDSMAMLHLVCHSGRYAPDELVIAHFDHGIRENSAADAQFVRRKAEEYGIECQIGEGKLGQGASEAEAREARYEFLRGVAKKYQTRTEIWTAHHLDDLIESIAINLVRGTGWRGLAVLDNPEIRRPLLETDLIYEPMDKMAIFEYAAKLGLKFREDPSNSWNEYLRNRIRHQMNNVGRFELEFGVGEESGLEPSVESELASDLARKMKIWELWRAQKLLKRQIDELVTGWLPKSEEWQRVWFQELAPEVGLELLKAGTLRAGIAATRPQLENFRQAILHYGSGKYFNLPGDRLVKIGRDRFKL